MVDCENCRGLFAIGVRFIRCYQGLRTDKLPLCMVIPGARLKEEFEVKEGLDPMTVGWIRDAVLESMARSSLDSDWTWSGDLSVVV